MMQLVKERVPYGPRLYRKRRDKKIMEMFEGGMTRHQIAETMGVSYCIVKDALHAKYPRKRIAIPKSKVAKKPMKRVGWLRRFLRWIW